MIIRCGDLSEFFDELKNVWTSSSSLYQNMVRVSVSDRPLTDRPNQNQHDAVRHEVGLHAGAIVRVEEGGEYLVQYSEVCGIDYHDASQSFDGTKQAKKIKKQIQAKCGDLGLGVGPGIIEL